MAMLLFNMGLVLLKNKVVGARTILLLPQGRSLGSALKALWGS